MARDIPKTTLSEDPATFARLKAPVKRVCALHVPIPYSPVLEDAILYSQFFGDRTLRAQTLASSLVGSLARRSPEDLAILSKYWHGVIEPRSQAEGGQWPAFMDGGRQAISTLS